MLEKIIKDWKLNQTLLAKMLGITRGSFNNKLIGETYKFTAQEKSKLIEILNALKKDIEKL